ncbi:MCP four helix bundle domain-containing protein, partial [Novosphingobium sp. ZW T3_23]|uniref:MCP four helix bundle domain-containing protein n=1 Tax=Novosphingobium sp. ZW T3_23 TaxID=3378084 RepID=UPI0038521565
MLEFLNDWKLPRKLLAAFGVLSVLFAIVGLNGLISSRKLDAIAQNHVEHGIASMSALADVIGSVKEMRIIVYTYYAAVNTPAEEADVRQRLEKTKASLAAAVGEYRQVADENFAAEATALAAKVDALNKANDHMFAARAAGDMAGAMAVLKGEARNASHDIIDQTEKLLDESRERSKEKAAEGAETATFAIWLSGGLAALGIAGIVIIWRVLNRTVAAPMSRITQVTTALAEGGKVEVPFRERGDEIGEIAEAVEQFRSAAEARAEIDARAAREQELVTSTLRSSLQAISEGDLTQSINADFPPAYGELKSNFNTAVGALRELIGAVAESAVAIRTGSSEIAQASEDLARRTESNAASLEETSAAITQMDDRLRATAAAAGRTVQRADGAMTVVGSGREIADEA